MSVLVLINWSQRPIKIIDELSCKNKYSGPYMHMHEHKESNKNPTVRASRGSSYRQLLHINLSHGPFWPKKWKKEERDNVFYFIFYLYVRLRNKFGAINIFEKSIVLKKKNMMSIKSHCVDTISCTDEMTWSFFTHCQFLRYVYLRRMKFEEICIILIHMIWVWDISKIEVSH